MNNSSAKVAELRKVLALTQVELAKRAGLSQGTISRIEAGEDPPTDVRLWIKVAKALGEPVANLLPEELLQSLAGAEPDTFSAFCPNPFCDRNQLGKEDGEAFVKWTSASKFQSHVFDKVNYCGRCGEELIKDCPSCGRKLTSGGSQFCITCGESVCDRPTRDEWAKIKTLVDHREKSQGEADKKRGSTKPADKNIPFGDSHYKEDDIPF